MSSAVAVVCRKEVLETARDRRTLFSLLLGPLLGPLLFVVLINVVVSQNISSAEQPLTIPIAGGGDAPNLMAFLKARGISALADHGLKTIDDAAAAVTARTHDLVIVLDEQFAADFGTDRGARVTLIFDGSNSRVGSRVERVRSALGGYGQQIGVLRLVADGVDPALLRPLIVDEFDVSTPAGRSVLMLGVLTYFLLFATLTGGLHLAIDTTAGERERKSLEPLLTTPVSRTSLIVGKMAATALYMLLSLALTLAAFTVALAYMPLEQLGMSSSFDLPTALAVFAVLLPFAPLGAALMTTVASFTKTYREAQTYLTFVLLVPTLPVMFATMLNVEPKPTLMWIPSLSQHLLITSLIKQEPLDPSFVALSSASTLLIGAVVAFIATRLYRREGILG
jgi:sodium transport system permease protein